MALSPLPPGHGFSTEPWFLLGFAICIVIIRCLARIQVTGIRHLRLDDWGMKVAVVSTTETPPSASAYAHQNPMTDIIRLYRIVRPSHRPDH